jgi:hypothetical protein
MALVTGTAAALILQAGIDQFSLTLAPAARNAQFSNAAIAAPRYIPRPGSATPKRTQGTGSRGGCNDTTVAMTLLVPTTKEEVSFTTSTHPTFGWYLSNPVPVEFTLVEPGKAIPLYVQRIEATKSGIQTLKLPTTVAGLVPTAKPYRWSIRMVCNPERPSADIFAQAFIRRVSASDKMGTELATATTHTQRAEIYAANGLWYDAFGSLTLAQETNEPLAQQNQLQLLEQVELADLLKSESTRTSAK